MLHRNYSQRLITALAGRSPRRIGSRNPNRRGLFSRSARLEALEERLTLSSLPAVFLDPRQSFVTGVTPRSVLVGDLNGDDKLDLAVADLNSLHAQALTVRLNETATDASVSRFAAEQDFATGSMPAALALGDLNGDNLPELAVASLDSGLVSVLRNTTTTDAAGKITFGLAAQQNVRLDQPLPVENLPTYIGDHPYSIALGDINGDNKLDLVVANSGSNSVAVLLNTTTTGSDTFHFAVNLDFAVGLHPQSVVLGDINGDGTLDMVVGNRDSNTVSVLLNTTTSGNPASFAAKQDFTVGIAPLSVVIIGDINRAQPDLNDDGRPDLAVANSESDTVSVLLNTTAAGAATISFASKQDFPVGNTPVAVAAGDLNGDLRPDLAVANCGSNMVSALLSKTMPGDAASSFPVAKDFGAGLEPYSVALGDLNGDDRLDVAVGDTGVETVSVLLNTTLLDIDTAGVYDPKTSTFLLKFENSAGNADVTFGFGAPAETGKPDWTPLAGDWNGDGRDTIGLFQPAAAQFYLRNSNSSGSADVSFGYGDPAQGDQYVLLMGDWDGDGVDTIGLYHKPSAAWFLRDSNSEGIADVAFGYGVPSSDWTPLVGDWNGDGVDTIGLYDPATGMFYLRNSNVTGMADIAFSYGAIGSGWTPLVGDWDGDCRQSAGFYQPGAASHFYLRNEFSPGEADLSFGFGSAGVEPIMGNWLGIRSQTLLAAEGPLQSRDSSQYPAPSPESLAPLLSAALADWFAAGVEIQPPSEIGFADLPGLELGRLDGTTLLLDRDAAGNGWFIDPTPAANEEFAAVEDGASLRAVDSRGADRIDLLTVVEHELGHLAGLPDLEAALDNLMSGVLANGVRRKP